MDAIIRVFMSNIVQPNTGSNHRLPVISASEF